MYFHWNLLITIPRIHQLSNEGIFREAAHAIEARTIGPLGADRIHYVALPDADHSGQGH